MKYPERAFGGCGRGVRWRNLPAGHPETGHRCEHLRISSKIEESDGLSALANLLVGTGDGQLVYLQNVADISKGNADPPNTTTYYGHRAMTPEGGAHGGTKRACLLSCKRDERPNPVESAPP